MARDGIGSRREKTPAVAGASRFSRGYRATRTLIRWWMSTTPLNRTKVRSDSMRRTTRSSGARTVPAPATMVSPTTTSAAGMVIIRLVFISNSFLRRTLRLMSAVAGGPPRAR
ncbi:hypothetical protein SEA_DULCIE_93 [Mycobacterium phage Dulcie]|nr:hypothetical protein SEA_DULCIE_93 [Mycobacterium phage Dulcie]